MSTPSLVKNAADPDQVRKAAQKVESKQDREANDVRSVMNGVRGRRFIYKHLHKCGIWSDRFVAGVPDETAYQLGQRKAGLRLLYDVEQASPEAYDVMMKENREENNV